MLGRRVAVAGPVHCEAVQVELESVAMGDDQRRDDGRQPFRSRGAGRDSTRRSPRGRRESEGKEVGDIRSPQPGARRGPKIGTYGKAE